MENIRCDFDPATYLILSDEVAPLIYYSHFIAIFAALAISLLVFFHNPKSLVSRLFLTFSLVFSTWAFLDVLLWATNDPGIVSFSWSIQVLAEPIMYTLAFYLFYLFLYKKSPTLLINGFAILVLLPLIILLPTNLNLGPVYLSFCESEEGPLALYYTYFVNITFISLIVYIGLKKIPSLEVNQKRAAKFFIIGLIIFLLSFTVANSISSFTENWQISQYGLFGMPIFAVFIAYSIVQFQIFRIQVAGAQVLVVVLMGLVSSLLFVRNDLKVPITFITLIFTTITSFFLVRSVRKEFKQKLELEKLADKLEKANKRLKILDQMKSEFVSIASHQLRSPLTSIRGYASMLLEGTYGKLSKKGKEAIERIAESSRYMALSVEDYLNVSRIEAGRMKYEMSDFNLKEMVEKIVDDVRPAAIKRGLLLTFKSANLDSKGMVHGDIGKTRQIIHNLLDNSIKYTPGGSITVTVDDNKKKKHVFVEITDTGVGMDKETTEEVFEKFIRARNANEVNVTGTGLGLYVARQMAEGMQGEITATSPGKGKGSTFTLMLPMTK